VSPDSHGSTVAIILRAMAMNSGPQAPEVFADFEGYPNAGDNGRKAASAVIGCESAIVA